MDFCDGNAWFVKPQCSQMAAESVFQLRCNCLLHRSNLWSSLIIFVIKSVPHSIFHLTNQLRVRNDARGKHMCCKWRNGVLPSLSLSLFFSRVNVLELWNIREKMCAAFPYPFVRYSRFSPFCHVRHINDLLSYRIISPLFQHANSEHSLFHFPSPFRPFRCAIHFARFCLFISMEKCVNNSVFIAIVV